MLRRKLSKKASFLFYEVNLDRVWEKYYVPSLTFKAGLKFFKYSFTE